MGICREEPRRELISQSLQEVLVTDEVCDPPPQLLSSLKETLRWGVLFPAPTGILHRHKKHLGMQPIY